MRSPSTSMKFSFTVARLLLCDVEQHAVRVGEVMSAAGAALEEGEPRPALRSRAQGEGAQMRIVLAHGLQALLHGLQTLHPEADVIRAGPRDPAALVIEDAPRHDYQRDPAVAQIMAGVAGFPGKPLEAEQVDVELSDRVGVQSAQGEMADGARLLARGLDIDRSPVLHVLLRQVEEVARGIVGADAREGPRAGALQDFDRGVALAQSRADPFGVFHLHAEVVEPRRAARLARIDVEAHGAVADGHRPLRSLVGRAPHAEYRLVKSALERVLVADDGDVLDFCRHKSAASQKYFPEFFFVPVGFARETRAHIMLLQRNRGLPLREIVARRDASSIPDERLAFGRKQQVREQAGAVRGRRSGRDRDPASPGDEPGEGAYPVD